jgi:hypothetical protein
MNLYHSIARNVMLGVPEGPEKPLCPMVDLVIHYLEPVYGLGEDDKMVKQFTLKNLRLLMGTEELRHMAQALEEYADGLDEVAERYALSREENRNEV